MQRILLVIAFFAIIATVSSENSLRNVFLLWRHGDRAPYDDSLTPSTPLEDLWPEGSGQLTRTGVIQQYVLGDVLRHRYGSFVPQEYHYKYYHLRSSDYDRTLMSGLTNVAAFYANTSSPLKFLNLPWRPIPIHTVRFSRDALFANAKCPYLIDLFARNAESKQVQDIIQQHEAEMNIMEKNLGYRPSVSNIYGMDDEVICRRAHSIALPEWVTDGVVKLLSEASQLLWVVSVKCLDEILLQLRFSTVELLSLQVGVFLHNMFNHFETLIRDGNVTLLIDGRPEVMAPNHLMAYSGHDTNVQPILAAFGLDQPRRPNYTACVMVELHGPPFPNPPEEYQVSVFYRNSWEDKEVKEMPFRKFCAGQTRCPFPTVLKHMRQFMLSKPEWTKKCGGSMGGGYYPLLLGLLIVVLLIAFIALSVAIGLYVSRRRLRVDYSKLINENE